MNENINLCDILKGHEGETFYSPTFSNVRLDFIDKDYIAVVSDEDATSYKIFANGTYTKNGEICFFPSKDQRDWIKWDKENNHKTPKTWNELIKDNEILLMSRATSDPMYSETDAGTSIEKSALALLKIHQLIEIGYGGNVTDKSKEFYSFSYDVQYKKFVIREYKAVIFDNFILAFHIKEQAEEFLSYPENVQLLKDYFMI